MIRLIVGENFIPRFKSSTMFYFRKARYYPSSFWSKKYFKCCKTIETRDMTAIILLTISNIFPKNPFSSNNWSPPWIGDWQLWQRSTAKQTENPPSGEVDVPLLHPHFEQSGRWRYWRRSLRLRLLLWWLRGRGALEASHLGARWRILLTCRRPFN